MIKMVIFCVIAFALTWLPFNTLIIYGEIDEKTWENQNIMYIWFTTHFLAMCHTVTNPLIYIWMNNRFRAGFKQVIGDIYQGSQKLLAYLCCYCLCCGCLFDCSRRKYARVMVEMNRKNPRRPLTSSGSVNFANNSNNHHTHNNGDNGNHGPPAGGGGGGGGQLGASGGHNGGFSASAYGGAGATTTTTANHFSSTNNTSSSGGWRAGRGLGHHSRYGPETTSTGLTIGQPSSRCCESLLLQPPSTSYADTNNTPIGYGSESGKGGKKVIAASTTTNKSKISIASASGRCNCKPNNLGHLNSEDLRRFGETNAASTRRASDRMQSSGRMDDGHHQKSANINTKMMTDGNSCNHAIALTFKERRRMANKHASGQRQLSSSNPSLASGFCCCAIDRSTSCLQRAHCCGSAAGVLTTAASMAAVSSKIDIDSEIPEVVVVSGGLDDRSVQQAGTTTSTASSSHGGSGVQLGGLARMGFKPMQMFRRKLNNSNHLDKCEVKETSFHLQKQVKSKTAVDTVTESASANTTKAKRRKKRRHLRSHNVALRLTTTEFYQMPSGNNTAGLGRDDHQTITIQPYNQRTITTRTRTTANGASTLTGPVTTKQTTKSSPSDANENQAKRKVLVEMNQSSQSSATISAQTNFTSLAMSPLNSKLASVTAAAAATKTITAAATISTTTTRYLDQQREHWNGNGSGHYNGNNNNDNSTSVSSTAFSNENGTGNGGTSSSRVLHTDHLRNLDGEGGGPCTISKSGSSHRMHPIDSDSIGWAAVARVSEFAVASSHQHHDHHGSSGSGRMVMVAGKSPIMQKVRPFSTQSIDRLPIYAYNRRLTTDQINDNGICSASPTNRQAGLLIKMGQESSVNNVLISRSDRTSVEVLGRTVDLVNQTTRNNSSEDGSPLVANRHKEGTISEQTSYLSHDDADELLDRPVNSSVHNLDHLKFMDDRQSSHGVDSNADKWNTDNHDIESSHLQGGCVESDDEYDDEVLESGDEDEEDHGGESSESNDVQGQEDDETESASDELDDLEIEYGDQAEWSPMKRDILRSGQVAGSNANNDAIKMVKLRTYHCDSKSNNNENGNGCDAMQKQQNQRRTLGLKHLQLLNRLFWSMDNHLNEQNHHHHMTIPSAKNHLQSNGMKKTGGPKKGEHQSELSKLASQIQDFRLTHHNSCEPFEEHVKLANSNGCLSIDDTTATNGYVIRSANSAGNCTASATNEPLLL